MLRYYRRNLPHLRADGTPCVYYVTWRLSQRQQPLSPFERTVVAHALLHFHKQRYELVAFVVMDDHVHTLLAMAPEQTLERVTHSWKSFTAHELVRRGQRFPPVWQDECFDRIVRDDAELREKLDYVTGNPWKRWPDLGEYEWVWVGDGGGLLG